MIVSLGFVCFLFGRVKVKCNFVSFIPLDIASALFLKKNSRAPSGKHFKVEEGEGSAVAIRH